MTHRNPLHFEYQTKFGIYMKILHIKVQTAPHPFSQAINVNLRERNRSGIMGECICKLSSTLRCLNDT